MKYLSLGAALLIAACGGGSTKPTTPIVDPVPMAEPAEPTAAAEPVTPAPPAEPATPPAPDPAQVKADFLAAETAAYDAAKPVFEKYCASCHSKGQRGAKAKTLEHFEITTYPFGGHHAMEVGKEVREVLAIGGGKPTMPKNKPGIVTGDELAAIAAWADAFDASHAGGAHEGHGDAGHGGHQH